MRDLVAEKRIGESTLPPCGLVYEPINGEALRERASFLRPGTFVGSRLWLHRGVFGAFDFCLLKCTGVERKAHGW